MSPVSLTLTGIAAASPRPANGIASYAAQSRSAADRSRVGGFPHRH